MSFILDALRKSENSRLRQDHPAVFTHRIAAQRQRLPVWGMALIALLAVNLLIVSFLLIREASVDSPKSSPSPTVAVPANASLIDAPISPVRTLPAEPVKSTIESIPIEIPKSEGLLTRDDLLARGSRLPSTDLNMHVYDSNPALRFVLLNGQRLREGESSQEGLLVEAITPQGIILRYGDSSFAVNLQ
ncbi:MAG: hypothetical protein EBT64_00170 [Gammaproteobacteria bacterium]|jgi:general secretion pathway protein B|nr:hypothetical protein [Gammaproteobacteria bacterium]